MHKTVDSKNLIRRIQVRTLRTINVHFSSLWFYYADFVISVEQFNGCRCYTYVADLLINFIKI